MRTKQVSGILKLGYNNDPPFKEVCSRDLSTACRRWFNSTTTEGLVKVVYGCSFQSLWLQQPPIEGALQRRIILGADTAWRLEEECDIFKYQPPFPGADPEIFDWRWGGRRVGDGPNFGSERTPSPLPTAAVARYFKIFKIFWPLTVCRCTRKGYTLGTASSVNAGRCWRGKYCFASRGEQIGGEYPKTITFFNISGILISGKMQRAFH